VAIVLDLLPLMVVLGCIGFGVRPVKAGLIGLALTLPVAMGSLGDPATAGPVLMMATVRALWLVWPAVAVIFAGLFFHTVLALPLERTPTAPDALEGSKHRSLFMVCFLLGPFAESATGFGVGATITGAAVLRMGFKGADAASLLPVQPDPGAVGGVGRRNHHGRGAGRHAAR